MGGWDKTSVPWKAVGRGWDEVGGYMNVGVGRDDGAKGRAHFTNGEKQYQSYVSTFEKIARNWARSTVKLHKTNMDQVMAFYPIAYATRPTRKLESGFVNGITIPAQEFGTYSDGSSHKTREFQIFQSCKTNLRIATVLEGDARFKAIVPYQGMHTSIPVYEGDLTMDWLDFRQQWEFHAGGYSLGEGALYIGPAWHAVRGSKYYRRENGQDLPFNQSYLDALFNNQVPA